mgnify:CR=1 FL=1
MMARKYKYCHFDKWGYVNAINENASIRIGYDPGGVIAVPPQVFDICGQWVTVPSECDGLLSGVIADLLTEERDTILAMKPNLGPLFGDRVTRIDLFIMLMRVCFNDPERKETHVTQTQGCCGRFGLG